MSDEILEKLGKELDKMLEKIDKVLEDLDEEEKKFIKNMYASTTIELLERNYTFCQAISMIGESGLIGAMYTFKPLYPKINEHHWADCVLKYFDLKKKTGRDIKINGLDLALDLDLITQEEYETFFEKQEDNEEDIRREEAMSHPVYVDEELEFSFALGEVSKEEYERIKKEDREYFEKARNELYLRRTMTEDKVPEIVKQMLKEYEESEIHIEIPDDLPF